MYYFLEKQFETKSIIFSNEKINAGLFDISLTGSNITYEEKKFAKVEKLKLTSYLFYNTLEIKNIEVMKKFTKKYPVKTDEFIVKYSVLNPLFVDINAQGDFGILKGKVDLVKQKITYVLKASKSMKKNYQQILRKMKQTKGEYIYEQQL